MLPQATEIAIGNNGEFLMYKVKLSWVTSSVSRLRSENNLETWAEDVVYSPFTHLTLLVTWESLINGEFV